jgi:putative DNA primase/helicase
MLADYVKLIADANGYNPVVDWVSSIQWDGVTRIQALCETVKVRGERALVDKLIFRWLVSAVAAAFNDFGFESHGVLVFTGSQGQGKTKWVKRLVSALPDVVLAGAVLDPANKDTVTNAIGHWIVELGELDATFRKADIARLKAFITNSTDKVRRPYDRIESEYQRRTVFFASVNEDKYLVDDTGNRRWWTVPVLDVDYNHNIDVQQVWAEVLHMWRNGAQHWLTDDEFNALNKANAEHENTDPIEESILRAFDWSQLNVFGGREMTATEVLQVIGHDKPNKAQATHASKVLRKLTGSDPRRTSIGRFFKMPPKANGRDATEDGRPF